MQYNTQPIYNLLQVQITVTNNAAGGKFYFPDLPQLRDAKIYGIVYQPANLLSKDVNNVNLVTIADTSSCYLTLYSGNKEAIQQLPLVKLISYGQNATAGNTFASADGIFNLNNLIIDFSKSFVQLGAGVSLTTTLPASFMFSIYYIK